MAIVALTATKRAGNTTAIPGSPMKAGVLLVFERVVTVGAADSDTSTYDFGEFPSNMRISGLSQVQWADLASSGAPTIDFGVYGSQITNDVDALSLDHDAATVNLAVGRRLIGNPANNGKMLWEFVNGQTTDPGGMLRIKAVLDDADVNTGGALAATIVGYFD